LGECLEHKCIPEALLFFTRIEWRAARYCGFDYPVPIDLRGVNRQFPYPVRRNLARYGVSYSIGKYLFIYIQGMSKECFEF